VGGKALVSLRLCVRCPGYSVGGHEFLSDLPTAERTAVIEYLKTL